MTIDLSTLVGKTLTMTRSDDTFTGIIDSIYDDNTLLLNRESLTSNLSNLQSTFNYEDSFTTEFDIGYNNNGDNAWVQGAYSWDFAYPMSPDIVFMSFDYTWDILVTHTPTGHTFQQELYYNPYTVSNNWAFFQFWYEHAGITDMSSPIGFAASRPSIFPFEGSMSGKTTTVSRMNWKLDYQGKTTLTMQFKLNVYYQAPHNYTGHITLHLTNIKYFNCRGEEIKNGDKCLPILSGLTGTFT